MPIDMFNTRTMLRALLQHFTPKTFLMKTFFNNVETFDTESVDIDSAEAKRRVAPFVRPRKGGKTVDRGGYSTKSYKPPLVGPQCVTTAEDLLKRTPGETIYGGEKTSEQRAAEQLGKDMASLEDMITRREEVMAAQALFDGKIVLYDPDEGIDEEMDFGLPSVALSGGSLWSATTSDPLADFKAWASLMRKNSGYSPTMAILGGDAASALLENEKLLKFMDMRRVDMGEIKPAEMPNGTSYLGRLLAPGVSLDLFCYEEWAYDEATGTNKEIVPAKKILLANPASRYDMLYGAVSNVKIGVVAARRVPFSWEEPDGSARYVRLSCRPLPVPVEKNASLRCTVLG